MPMKAMCVLNGIEAKGMVLFEQEDDESPVTIRGKITGLTPGDHGIHVHEFGDHTHGINHGAFCGAFLGCVSTGHHFNPHMTDHGSPDSEVRHVGDMGNITAAKDGTAKFEMTDKMMQLMGEHSIVGRSLVVHLEPDDFGKGGLPQSMVTGNAGARVCCGVIGYAKETMEPGF